MNGGGGGGEGGGGGGGGDQLKEVSRGGAAAAVGYGEQAGPAEELHTGPKTEEGGLDSSHSEEQTTAMIIIQMTKMGCRTVKVPLKVLS